MEIRWGPGPLLPRPYPWSERVWASWDARARPMRLPSRTYALHALMLCSGRLDVSADRHMSSPVTVVWSGQGQWGVLERAAGLQWVDSRATLPVTGPSTVAHGLRAYRVPGAAMDAARAVEAAARVALAGIDAPATLADLVPVELS